MKRSMVLASVVFLASSLWVSACMVIHPRGVRVAVPVPVVKVHYAPLHYSGHVVYYTANGVPFYWASGGKVFLPHHHRHKYVSHYRRHHHAYHKWHKSQGKSHKPRAVKKKKKRSRDRRHDHGSRRG